LGSNVRVAIMLSEIQRLKVVGTQAEPILLLLLKLEESAPAGISMTLIKAAASKAHPDLDVYKATCALRSIGFMRSVQFTSIAEGEARLAVARNELAKAPAAIDLGRRAGLFLLGQRSVIDSLAKHGMDITSREELEAQVRPLRHKFYRKLYDRVLGKSKPTPVMA
jgi:uncharacterized small protein (DUF1192 family)